MLALQQLDDRMNTQREWMKDYRFTLVKSVKQLTQLVDMCIKRGSCSLDLETTGVDNRIYPDEYFNDGKKTKHGLRTIDKIAGICISFDGQNGYYIPVGHYPKDSGNLDWDEAWDEITRLVHNCRIIFHGSKFDCEFLYPVTGKDHWKLDEYEDTFLMSKVISPLKQSPNGLKPLTKLHFNVEMLELDDLFTPERREQMKREKQGYNFAMLDPKEGLEYGCSDGIFTYKLRDVLLPKLSPSDMDIYNLEKSFCNVMRELERNRVHVDVERVQYLLTECKLEMQKTGDAIRDVIESKTGKTGKWVAINIGSTDDLCTAMITDAEGLKLKPTPEMVSQEFGDGGGGDSDDDDDDDGGPSEQKYSLKDEALKSLHRVYGHKFMVQREGHVDKEGQPKKESIFELILEWRHYQKMEGSYLRPLSLAVDKNGDVRPNFNQIGTDTTRLSSKAGKIIDGYSGINFQGIPRDSDEDKPELFKQLRTCIIPRPGWVLVKLDYAGEELRVVTNLSGDPIWTKSFLYEDGDVHSITARTLFHTKEVNKDQRNRGKRCNFAFIYGGGAGAIQRNVGCSIEEAAKHMEALRNDVPVLMGYVEFQKAYARKHKCIYTAFGRRIPIPTIDSPVRGIRAKAERCAINYTIQATSADVIKYAMCYVDKNLRKLGWKDRCRYVLTVHDEVVYEVKPEHLMEVVRKLDEWMTEPWRLPKAHGRDWVVPLLTEPGIDCHWRARFDYFAMVDGAPASPKDIAEDGTFKGKLKKDQYFADGRIYQKVPDFLEPWIRRLPVKKKEEPTEPTDDVAAPAVPQPEDPEPVRSEPEPVAESVPVPEPESARAEEEPAKSAPLTPPPPTLSPAVEETVTKEEEPEPVKVEESTPPSPEPPASKSEPQPAPSKPKGGGFSLDDLDVPAPAAAPPQEAKAPAPPSPPEEFDLDAGFGESSEPRPQAQKPIKGKASERERPPLPTDGQVLRWVMRAPFNMRNQKKLWAVCVLAEGKTPLRVVDTSGNIIVEDSAGVLVDSAGFLTLASLFGLS